jgi:hypothetical protein
MCARTFNRPSNSRQSSSHSHSRKCGRTINSQSNSRQSSSCRHSYGRKISSQGNSS